MKFWSPPEEGQRTKTGSQRSHIDDERLLGGTSSTAGEELCKTISQRQGINKEWLLTGFLSIRCIPGEQQVAGSKHTKKRWFLHTVCNSAVGFLAAGSSGW